MVKKKRSRKPNIKNRLWFDNNSKNPRFYREYLNKPKNEEKAVIRTNYNHKLYDLKDYPDKCRFCGGPAYIRMNNTIDCLHNCKESQEHNNS
jgi:hypothetical protein